MPAVLPLLALLGLASGLRGLLPVASRFAGCPGDLAVDLVCQLFHLALGKPQCGGLVPENALGGTLHSLAKLADPLAGEARRFRRLLGDASLGKLPGLLDRVGDLLLVGLADGVEQVLGQEGFGFLGIADGPAHLIDELVQLLLLLFQRLLDLLAIGRAAQGLAGAVLPGIEFLGESALGLVKLFGLVAHCGHSRRRTGWTTACAGRRGRC